MCHQPTNGLVISTTVDALDCAKDAIELARLACQIQQRHRTVLARDVWTPRPPCDLPHGVSQNQSVGVAVHAKQVEDPPGALIVHNTQVRVPGVGVWRRDVCNSATEDECSCHCAGTHQVGNTLFSDAVQLRVTFLQRGTDVVECAGLRHRGCHELADQLGRIVKPNHVPDLNQLADPFRA